MARISLLSPAAARRTSTAVPELFDHCLRALRRDRAVRTGVENFLYNRAFEDCLERLADMNRRFDRILLAGCPNTEWPSRLGSHSVSVVDPGPLMALAVGGKVGDLETLPFNAGEFDLVITVGLLETANHLPLAAAALELVLKPGGLLLGAVIGGHSFPQLRKAMLAADALSGHAAPHVHPRIEAPSLAGLLSAAQFLEPVVDIDRVDLRYSSLDRLVADLRAMGATNILAARPRQPLSRPALSAAREAFLNGQNRAVESVEILHFAAWKRPQI